MLDKKHIGLVQKNLGMILDAAREQTKHHDEDKANREKHDATNLPRHHLLVTDDPTVNIIDVLEALADNMGGYDEYRSEVRFPVSKKWSGLEPVLENTIRMFYPQANVKFVRTRD